jgi:putative ABC transport system ATP-binding protein
MISTASGKHPEELKVGGGSVMLELRKVSRVYLLGTQKVTGLMEADLRIRAGEFLAVVGPSGSGKSTLLNILSLIDSPTSGGVLFNGQDTKGMDDDKITAFRNQNVGIIFQSFNLLPVLNALENVAMALQIRGEGKSSRLDKAEAMLKSVGLGSHLKHRPDNLSGGQRQRVAIARALVTQPKVVIADEPTAALDSHTARDIITLLKQINEEKKTTFIFSTHDTRIIDQVAKRLRMEDGCLTQEGN